MRRKRARESGHRSDADRSAEPSRQPIICVLGMHRSGTSVATRILNLLGIYLGPEEHLIGSRPDNPKGFWECQPIVDLNVEILERLGGNWHELPIFRRAGRRSGAGGPSPESQDVGRSILRRGQLGLEGSTNMFDPRVWKQLLPPMHYVICLRSPVEVAESLTKRDGFSTEKSIRLWQSYTGDAIEHTAGLMRHFIFYEDLINSHRKEVSRLARFVGRHDVLEQPALSSAIDKVIDADDYHNRTSFLNTLDDPKVLFLPRRSMSHFAARPGPVVLPTKFRGSRDWTCSGSKSGRSSADARVAQAEWDELSSSQAGPQMRIAEWSAEVQALRTSSRDLEENNRRLTEERDQAEAVARELAPGWTSESLPVRG